MGVYRFWRDMGYAVGALMAGLVAGAFGLVWSIHVAGALTFASGLVAWVAIRETRRGPPSGAPSRASAVLAPPLFHA